MHITPVTEASQEQRHHLATLARSKLPPHSCTCSDNPYWDPDDPCYCEPTDPFDDWDRRDMMWASLGPANIVYGVLSTARILAVRILFCDDDQLLDTLVHRLLKLEHTQCRGVAALVDRPPWPTSKLRLQPTPPICGRPFTAAVIHRTPRLKHVAATVTLAVHVGLTPRSSPDPITWLPDPVPITLSLSGSFLFVDLPPLPFPLEKDPEDACLHIRWGQHDLLDHRHMVRPCKFNTYAVHGRQFWQKGSYLDMLSEWPEDPITRTRPHAPDVALVTLQAIPLLDRQARRTYYLRELRHLRHALAFLLTRARRAAYTIQRHWRRSICDPQFALARRRLHREFAELSTLNPV